MPSINNISQFTLGELGFYLILLQELRDVNYAKS